MMNESNPSAVPSESGGEIPARQNSLPRRRQSKRILIDTYTCTLWKGFFDMKHKLYTVHDLDVQQAVNHGIRLIDNLFWILYNYSSNLQLTMFLTERGRLLYSEFLSMSRTHPLMKQAHAYPTIQDGFQFAIKKSIGALTCKETSPITIIPFERIARYRNLYRRIFETINRKYLTSVDHMPWSDDRVNLMLHNLNHMLSMAVRNDGGQHMLTVVATSATQRLALTPFLLLLSLLADNIVNRRHVALADIQQFVAQSGVDSDEVSQHLSCLETSHRVQQQWRQTVAARKKRRIAAGGRRTMAIL
jgi:hypothetical protein